MAEAHPRSRVTLGVPGGYERRPGYGRAILLTAVALALALALRGPAGFAPLTFIAWAVAVSALAWGFGPAMLAAIAGTIVTALLFPAREGIAGLDPNASLRFGLFLVFALGVGGVGERLRERRSRAESLAEERARMLAETERAQAEAKRAADALAATEAKLTQLVGQVKDHAIVAVTLDGTILSWNEGVKRVLGWDEDELVGQPAAVLFTPEDRARGVPEGERAEAIERGTAGGDRWMVRKDGTRFWAGGSTNVTRDEQGKPIGFLKILRDLTREKALEDALRASEERVRLAIGASGLGYWRWDAATDRTDHDALSAAHFGVAPDEIAMLDANLERIHPDDRAAVRGQMAGTLSGGAPLELEFRVVQPSGASRWLLARGDAVLDAAGNAVAVTGVNVDVTDRKRAEAALRAHEEHARSLVDEAPVVLWLTRGDEGRVYVSRRWYELTGQTDAEPLGDGWIEAVHPDDRERVRAAHDAARGRGAPLRVEYRLRRADGRYRFVLDTAVPRHDAEGETVGLVGSVVDITERREAEQALRASEERLRLAQAATQIGVWEWDVEPNEARCSPEWFDVHGAERSDAPQSREGWLAHVHPDDRARVTETFARAVDGGLPFDEEYRVVARDGSVRWVADRGRAILEPLGRVQRYVGVVLDMTAQKARTDDEREVKHAKALRRLAGGVAHEVTDQMTVALGLADFVLGRTDLPAPARSDVEGIRRAAERSSQIALQMLAFSRQLVLARERVDVNAMIAEQEPRLRGKLGPAIELELALDPRPLVVHADRGQLAEVLTHLAENARDALGEGGTLRIETRTVEVDARARAHGGAEWMVERRSSAFAGRRPHACIAVSDTGEGMDEATLARAFEPFFTTRRERRRAGLGLATVEGIVRQHEGFVDLESRAGKGTTVRVCLPLAEPPADPPRAAEAEERASGTILVVDDDPAVRRIATRILADAGFEILEAENGRAALAVLARHDGPVALVLTDLVMPEMDGRELCRRLAEERPELPVLPMSGYSAAASVSTEQPPNVVGFLAKPFTPSQLVQKVRELVEARAGAPTA